MDREAGRENGMAIKSCAAAKLYGSEIKSPRIDAASPE